MIHFIKSLSHQIKHLTLKLDWSLAADLSLSVSILMPDKTAPVLFLLRALTQAPTHIPTLTPTHTHTYTQTQRNYCLILSGQKRTVGITHESHHRYTSPKSDLHSCCCFIIQIIIQICANTLECTVYKITMHVNQLHIDNSRNTPVTVCGEPGVAYSFAVARHFSLLRTIFDGHNHTNNSSCI